MAYPASLDTLDNPLASDPRVGHAALHGSVNDAIEALEAKVGTGASTPATIGDVLTVTGTGATAWQTPAAGGLLSETVTLTSADILDLHTTPATLVAAPGAGKFVNPHRAVGYYSHETTEYVFSGGLMFLTYGSTSLGEFDATGSQDVITPWATTVKVVASEAVNAALLLFVADPITDGDGTLTITVWYSIEDVP